MRWLGTACFEIVLPSGKTMVLDPYMDDSYTAPIRSDQIEGCDYILITHGHFDHVTDVGKLADRFGPKIFCSDTTANALIAQNGSDKVTGACQGDHRNHVHGTGSGPMVPTRLEASRSVPTVGAQLFFWRTDGFHQAVQFPI